MSDNDHLPASGEDPTDNLAAADAANEPNVCAADDEDGPQARRSGGPRHHVSERLIFHLDDRQVEGWALNMSRGGLRAIVEEQMNVGDEMELTIGEDNERQKVRVVWVRQEQDGAVIGVSFVASPFSSIPPPLLPGEHDDGTADRGVDDASSNGSSSTS